jgi:hypothetical protein
VLLEELLSRLLSGGDAAGRAQRLDPRGLGLRPQGATRELGRVPIEQRQRLRRRAGVERTPCRAQELELALEGLRVER